MFSGSGSLDKRRTTMGDTQANQRKKTRGEDYIAQGSILAGGGGGGCDHEDYRSCVPYPADKHIRG